MVDSEALRKKIMIRNLYLVLVVVIRAVSAFVILSGVFAWGTGLVVTRGVGLGIPLLAMLLPVVSGILLWFFAKPCAALITRDLEWPMKRAEPTVAANAADAAWLR